MEKAIDMFDNVDFDGKRIRIIEVYIVNLG